MTMEMIGVNVKDQQNANGMEIQLYEAALKSSDKWLRWSLGLVCVETTNWIQAQEYHCTVSQYIAFSGAAACSLLVSLLKCTKTAEQSMAGSKHV